MRTPLLSLLLLVLTVVDAAADASLTHARRAQALLGAEVWSQVIRLENSASASVYPRRFHALVFELAGILWFYTDVDGTQSFSLHRGRLAQEKADFAPLLRDIEPGFRNWTVVADDPADRETEAVDAELPNGCFIESYSALRRLAARGEPVREPQLLLYYFGTDGRRPQGHTVLTYEVGGKVHVFDPGRPELRLSYAATLAADPHRLARAVQGNTVRQARVLPVGLPEFPAGRVVVAAHRGERPEEVLQ